MTISLPKFFMIFVKEFIELNVNTDMMIKNATLAGLNINIANVFLSITRTHMLCCSNNYQYKFDKKLKEHFLIYTNFLITTMVNLFYCCKRVFILMNR